MRGAIAFDLRYRTNGVPCKEQRSFSARSKFNPAASGKGANAKAATAADMFDILPQTTGSENLSGPF